MKKIIDLLAAFGAVAGFFMVAIAAGEGAASVYARLGAVLTGFGLMLMPWVVRTWRDISDETKD